MITRIQKWGNSLALRIPKPMADEMQLDQNSAVEIRHEKGQIIITPVLKPAFTLEQLLDQVNKENMHAEIDAGEPLGNEVW